MSWSWILGDGVVDADAPTLTMIPREADAGETTERLAYCVFGLRFTLVYISRTHDVNKPRPGRLHTSRVNTRFSTDPNDCRDPMEGHYSWTKPFLWGHIEELSYGSRLFGCSVDVYWESRRQWYYETYGRSSPVCLFTEMVQPLPWSHDCLGLVIIY